MMLQLLADFPTQEADRRRATDDRAMCYGKVISELRGQARDVAFNGSKSQLHRVSLTANHSLISKDRSHAIDGGRVKEHIVNLTSDRKNKTMPTKKATQGSVEATSTHGLGAVVELQNCTSKWTKPKEICVHMGEPHGRA
ncbi:TPA: hypothetical protein ACOEOH_000338 [Stenotrophomonas maltophilia]